MVLFGGLSRGHPQTFSPETVSRTVHLVNHFLFNYRLGFLFLGNFLLYQSVKVPLVWLCLMQWSELSVWWPVQKHPTWYFHICCRWNHQEIGGLAAHVALWLWHSRKELTLVHRGCTACVWMGTKQKPVSEIRLRKLVCWWAVIFGKIRGYS